MINRLLIVITITKIIIIIKKSWYLIYSLPININWNFCQYLSMYFLVSKVLIWEVVQFFKMTSPKAVCILYQALTAPIVIEFFPYKFVRNESLNNLPVEEADIL